MPLPPPPNTLTLEEFTKRYRAGARTIEELDPEFCQWRKNNHPFINFMSFMVKLFSLCLRASVVKRKE